MLDGHDFDQVRIFELGNSLFAASGWLRAGRLRSLAWVVEVDALSVLILVIASGVDGGSAGGVVANVAGLCRRGGQSVPEDVVAVVTAGLRLLRVGKRAPGGDGL